MDRPSLFNLEKSLHAPSPLITGKVTTISDTRYSIGMTSPNINAGGVTIRSPNAKVIALKSPKILEKPDEHDISSDSDQLEPVSCENNTLKVEMRKYSNAIQFSGLTKYTSPGPVKPTLSTMNTAADTQRIMPTATTTATTVTATTTNPKPVVPLQRALNIQGNLLKFTTAASPSIPSTLPTTVPITKPTVQKAINVQGNLLRLLNPEAVPETKPTTTNIPIIPRKQEKRKPLMNFLKPFY